MRKRTVLIRLVVLAIFGIATLNLSSEGRVENNRWERIGPSAGTIQQLVPYRIDPNIIFAINDASMYRSIDQGNHWQKIPVPNAQFVQIAMKTRQVFALSYVILGIYSPGNATLWISNDEGKSFQVREKFEFPMQKIFIHPQNPLFMIGLGIEGITGMAISEDGGRNWKRIFNSTEYYEFYFNDVIFSPLDVKTIYASGSRYINHGGNHDFRIVSNDGGHSWKRLGGRNCSFNFDAAFPRRAFATSCKGIEALTSTGWERLSSQPLKQIISVPNHPKLFYGIEACDVEFGRERLWKSADGGRHWKVEEFPYENALTKLAAPAGNTLLAGTAGAGLYSRSQLSQWTVNKSGFHEGKAVQVATGGKGEFVYATSLESRLIGNREFTQQFLYRWDADRRSWSNLSLGLDPAEGGHTIDQVAVNPLDSKQVLCEVRVQGQGVVSVLYSNDAGKSWFPSVFDDRVFPAAVTFDSSNPGTIYYGSECKSVDGGRTFHAMPFATYSCGGGRTVIDPRNPNILYLARRHLYKSIDGGKTVQLLSKKIQPVELVPLSNRDAFLLMTRSGNFYRTADGGETWNKISKIPTYDSFGFARLHAADNSGKHFFAVLDPSYLPQGRLYESRDGALTWKLINSEFGDSAEVFSLTDPVHRPFYVATNKGVFVSTTDR